MTASPAPQLYTHDADAHVGNERGRLLRWVSCWIILPNVGFCLLWLFGAPPRTAEIVGAGVVGLVLRHRYPAAQFAALNVVLAYSCVSYVSAVFNLAPTQIVASARFLLELKPAGSTEYLLAALAALVLLATAWRAFQRPGDFGSVPALLAAVTAIAGLAGLDYAVSYQSRGAYKRLPRANAPFSSAVKQSAFLRGADGRRHLILVTVEAMGDPVAPALRKVMLGRWLRSDIRSRYKVRTGRTPYYGSTTNGEVRELCGRWGDVVALDRSASHCLPAVLRDRGYRTIAMHSFTGDMFDREHWYPRVGFEQMLFRDGLVRTGAGRCGGVFPGACDRDVPRMIGERLRRAQMPHFVYWLTVNSHLPVPAEQAMRTEDCLRDRPDFPLRNGSICRLSTVIEQVDDALAEMLLSPGFPDADVLIVGDHMPPFFDHASRSQFDPSQVPWILLRRRESRDGVTIRRHGRS